MDAFSRYGHEAIEMDRRDFFKLGKKTISKAAFDVAKIRAEQKAKNWIRPPFAQSELDFLLSCTKCGDCIDACPHDVIFPLSLKAAGVTAVSTPAMDLLNKGCHLCEDWPCVTACKEPSLQLPNSESRLEGEAGVADDNNNEVEEEGEFIPQLAYARIDENTCLPYSGPECGACKSACPLPDALQWNGTKPVINQDVCNGCGLCREVCIADPKAVLISTVAFK